MKQSAKIQWVIITDNAVSYTHLYAGTPKKATSIGPITAAALIPANPVPMPAPAPARKIHKRQF